jgi:hypothetical protein
VNTPGASATSGRGAASGSGDQPSITQQSSGKAGAIDPFKQMVKDLTG